VNTRSIKKAASRVDENNNNVQGRHWLPVVRGLHQLGVLSVHAWFRERDPSQHGVNPTH